MPYYDYECPGCDKTVTIDKPMAESGRKEQCHTCGFSMIRVFNCHISGTRDSFGVGNEFRDKKTGKLIDNYRDWEKAGYSDPTKDGSLDNEVRERIKRKVDKINFDKKKKFSVNMGGSDGKKSN